MATYHIHQLYLYFIYHHINQLYLGHKFETPFYPGQGLLVQDAGLIGRYNSWVDEAQEHGAAHRTNAVLWEPLTHHLCGGGWREQGKTDEGKTKGETWKRWNRRKGLSRGPGLSKGEEKILKMDFSTFKSKARGDGNKIYMYQCVQQSRVR